MNGVNVKKLRRKMNVTQEAFAMELGVSVDSVRRWEQGVREPSALASKELERLAGNGDLDLCTDALQLIAGNCGDPAGLAQATLKTVTGGVPTPAT